jgi:hypothetical protein
MNAGIARLLGWPDLHSSAVICLEWKHTPQRSSIQMLRPSTQPNCYKLSRKVPTRACPCASSVHRVSRRPVAAHRVRAAD